MLKISYQADTAIIHGPESIISEVMSITRLVVDDTIAQKYVKLGAPLTISNSSTVGYVPEVYLSFRDKNGSLRLPTGLLIYLCRYFSRHRIPYEIVSQIETVQPLGEFLNPELWDHQKEMVKRGLSMGRCILKGPTGTGKSYVLAELAYQFPKTPLLIIVPGVLVSKQIHEDISEYLNESIGYVGGGRMSIKDKTVAIPQSLVSKIKSKNKQMLDYLNTVQVLLIDEAHTFSTPYSYFISKYLTNTSYRIGLTATPWREDDSKLLEGLMGPVTAAIDEREAIDKSIIMSFQVEYRQAPGVNYRFPLEYSHHAFAEAYKTCIIKNKGRNKLAVKIVQEHLEKDLGPLVIIVKYVDPGKLSHALIIQELLEEVGIQMPIISTNTPPYAKEQLILKLKESSIAGVIAGPKIISTGISIKSLGGLLLLAAGSSKTELIQRYGRVLRTYKGKKNPIIYDFIDQDGWFAAQSAKRIQAVKEIYGEQVIKYKWG